MNMFRSLLVSASAFALLAAPVLAQQFPAVIDLGALNSADGAKLHAQGISTFGAFVSVATLPDINGDGIDDMVVGDGSHVPFQKGAAWVVFGQAGGLSNPVDLANLDGLDGFLLNGTATFSLMGLSSNSAGDFNHDGVAVLIVAARSDSPYSFSGAGTSALGPNVATTIGAGPSFFGVFASDQASGGIALDPAVNRVFLRFTDVGGTVRSVTSAAVTVP